MKTSTSLKSLSFVLSFAFASTTFGAPLSVGLQNKLDAIFARWDGAHTQFAQVVGKEGKTLSRPEWEKLLGDDPSLALTPSELTELRDNQSERVKVSQALAEGQSALSLNAVRSANGEAEFCKGLPKGGMLHVHPWGTLDDTTLDAILADVNPVLKISALKAMLDPANATNGAFLNPSEFDFLGTILDQTTYQELSAETQKRLRALFFLPEPPEGSYPFKRFMAPFVFVSQLIFSNPQKDPSPKMWDSLFARAQANHIKYLEISGTMMAKESWLTGLVDWQNKYLANNQVQGVFLGALLRHQDPQKLRASVKRMTDLLKTLPEDAPFRKVFQGINLVADESLYPALEAGQGAYAELALSQLENPKTALHSTLHAGELGLIENSRDAMVMGAERLGHGVRLADDPVSLEYAARKALPVEVNLTSNLRLGVVSELRRHPLMKMVRLGLRPSLSTDDEGIFVTDLNQDCERAIRDTDLNYAELRKILLASIETSFLPEDQKAKLLQAYKDELDAYERFWIKGHP